MMHGKAVAPPGETGPAFYDKPDPGSGKRRDTPEVVLQRVDRPQVDLTGFREAAAGSDPAERELIRDLTEEISAARGPLTSSDTPATAGERTAGTDPDIMNGAEHQEAHRP